MVSFSDLRKSFSFQRQASKIQKELKNTHVEAEASGVTVTVSGGLEVISVDIGDDVPREHIASRILDATNRALKKAQVVSAEKMQGIMGNLQM